MGQSARRFSTSVNGPGRGLILAANGGIWFRPDRQLAGIRIGNMASFGVSAEAYVVQRWGLSVIGEVYGYPSLTSFPDKPKDIPAEVLLDAAASTVARTDDRAAARPRTDVPPASTCFGGGSSANLSDSPSLLVFSVARRRAIQMGSLVANAVALVFESVSLSPRMTATPRASGTLEAHYAPTARVRLMDAATLQTALDVLGAQAAGIATWSRAILQTRSTGVLRRHMPHDAAEAARQLFAVLRDFDAAGVSLIWVETPPDAAEWDGVRDRLQRAAAA